MIQDSLALFDFNHPSEAQRWLSVDDVAMGGVSSSRLPIGADSVAYEVDFAANRQRQILSFPGARLRPTLRGRWVMAAPPFDPSELCSAGLMITDAQADPFRLASDWIAACP